MAPKRLVLFVPAATFPSRISNNPQMMMRIPAQNGLLKTKKIPAPSPVIVAKMLKAFGCILRLIRKEAIRFRCSRVKDINFFGRIRAVSWVWLLI
jgi:hypothetical protein